MLRNIFIVGAEKAGTTSLAEWIISNKLAVLLVPGVKEPYLYARSDFGSFAIPYYSEPALDASVGYATNVAALHRMPEHGVKVLFCLRNPFERSWSAYKMYKVLISSPTDDIDLRNRFKFQTTDHDRSILRTIKEIHELHFPAKSRNWIDGYLTDEATRISSSDFLEWIQYEISFYLVRGKWPFFSVIRNSLYFLQVRNILGRFRPDQTHLISIEKLSEPSGRNEFVKLVFDTSKETNAPSKIFSASDFSINEEKPDFIDSKFDFVRSIFKKDLSCLLDEIKNNALSTNFCNISELSKFLVSQAEPIK